jgi:hypothetical protein
MSVAAMRSAVRAARKRLRSARGHCPQCNPGGPPHIVATVGDERLLPAERDLPRCPNCGGVAGFVQVIKEVVVGGREELEAP